MSEPNQTSSGLSLFPKTFWGALAVICVCAAAVLIVDRVVVPKSVEARRLWTPLVIETNGNQSILGETRQLEFWTPSARTKDFLPVKNGSNYAKEKWQIIPSDDEVFKFGALLHSNGNILGYRRSEVWGHGRTEYKPGWWWSVNVTTNYTATDLVRAYMSFWKPPSPVLIEVIDNRGGLN
jgi:hypothetical protein